MAKNGISTKVAGNGSDPAATKLLRRNNKLALAQAKRSAVGTVGYRPYNVYNASLSVGRPWTKS